MVVVNGADGRCGKETRMRDERSVRWARRAVRACGPLLVAAVAWASTTGSRAEDAAPSGEPEAVQSPPAGCKSLGEIEGSNFSKSPNMVLAKANAMTLAKAAGATHVQWISEKSGHLKGPYELTYTVVAYRCPAPGTPSPGK
jgi:hypothetical protein